MVERRSLGDAMELTPAKLAFIQGDAAEGAKKQETKPGSESAASANTIELELPRSTAADPQETRPRSPRRTGRARVAEVVPEASELLGQVLVPVTIRLQRRVAQSLKRAYLEQRLRDGKPDTQQEIVEEAIVDWLVARKFLE